MFHLGFTELLIIICMFFILYSPNQYKSILGKLGTFFRNITTIKDNIYNDLNVIEHLKDAEITETDSNK